MTIDDFKQYIQFYEDNQALRDQFEETIRLILDCLVEIWY